MPETFFFTLQMRTRWFWLAKSSCFLSSTAFRCYVLKVMWKMVCVNSFQVGPGFGEQGCISPWRFPRTTLLLHLRESPPPHAFPLFKKSLSCLFARCYHRDHVEIESFLNLLIASEGSTAAVTELVRYIFCQLLGKTLFIELCSYTFNMSKIL